MTVKTHKDVSSFLQGDKRMIFFVSLFPSHCLSLCKYSVHANCLTCLITFCGTLTKHQIKGYFRAQFFAILHLSLLRTLLYQMADNRVKIKRQFCSLVARRFLRAKWGSFVCVPVNSSINTYTVIANRDKEIYI